MNEVSTPAASAQRHIPFLAWLKARLERVADGKAVVVVDLVPELLNNHGGGHGGVVMTLLDNAMANAALSRIAFTREVVTIDIHVAFMHPATGRLTASGRATGGGRSVCFCEADIAAMPTAKSSPGPRAPSATASRAACTSTTSAARDEPSHARCMNEAPNVADWIGRTTQLDDVITAAPVKAMSATLDRDDPPPATGQALPPLWHWLYFLPSERQSAIGPDGHPRRGGFLPPVTLPRRMWAGGRFEFRAPLRTGDAVRRSSRIADISTKRGKTELLVFVRVRHEIGGDDGVALTEEHGIVYREAPQAGALVEVPPQAPAGEQFARTVTPDPVLLFRYSALTFNGHRIHYDRSCVTEVEGYPGLIVHGPLIATLLVDLLRRERPDARLSAFEFRAVSPLFDTAPFTVCGRFDDPKRASLWARGPQDQLAMQARVTIA